MKRMHVMLRVRDLDESLRFYTELFGAGPTVQKPDYAKWMLEDPRVNFSIGRKGDGFGIEHLGIQAESGEELAELRERIGRAGGTVENEGETTCCYASSDKTWVVDAQGVAWEAFYTHGEAETYGPVPDGSGAEAGSRSARCCGPECCESDGTSAGKTATTAACC